MNDPQSPLKKEGKKVSFKDRADIVMIPHLLEENPLQEQTPIEQGTTYSSKFLLKAPKISTTAPNSYLRAQILTNSREISRTCPPWPVHIISLISEEFEHIYLTRF